VADYKFLEKKLKIKNKIFKKLKLPKFHGLIRILYEHGVNSTLTERTKLNLFK